MPTPLNLTYNPSNDCPWFARIRNFFTSVDLSTCQHVNLSPVTWLYMEFAFCCGVWGACPQAFRCESMPTPLNLTYILPYDCPCFVRMRNSFTSVDLSTVGLSTCQSVYLSTCQTVGLATCRPVNLLTFSIELDLHPIL